jgi:hypothetical protein
VLGIGAKQRGKVMSDHAAGRFVDIRMPTRVPPVSLSKRTTPSVWAAEPVRLRHASTLIGTCLAVPLRKWAMGSGRVEVHADQRD